MMRHEPSSDLWGKRWVPSVEEQDRLIREKMEKELQAKIAEQREASSEAGQEDLKNVKTGGFWGRVIAVLNRVAAAISAYEKQCEERAATEMAETTRSRRNKVLTYRGMATEEPRRKWITPMEEGPFKSMHDDAYDMLHHPAYGLLHNHHSRGMMEASAGLYTRDSMAVGGPEMWSPHSWPLSFNDSSPTSSCNSSFSGGSMGDGLP